MSHRAFKITVILFLYISVLFLSNPHSLFAEGTYSNLGTGDAADGSSDAINFSQGRVWTIDQYGKYIWLTQARDNTQMHWTWSNDLGANWTQGSEAYGALTRGSVAYDSINDKLHVIWAATDSNDGIIYRRYGITRDGSNNITAVAREDSGNVNLQLDTTATRVLEQPVALWVNDGSADGILVAIWSKRGSSLNEVRASMRRLSISAADGVAGNWIALDGTGDTFATDAPAVEGDKIFGDTSGTSNASAGIRGGSGSRKDDLYVFVHESDDNASDTILGYRGIWASGSLNWSGGWQSPVTLATTDLQFGYTLKEQLITKPVLDTTNDRLYVGFARYKSGGAGDTVSFAYLNSSDTASSTVDVYSANGTHSYAPTLDIAFDNTLGQLYVSYVESTTNGDNGSINYKTYDGSSLSNATRFYTSPGGTAGEDGSADIPILFENRTSNNRLLFAFRKNGALPPTIGDPHTIYWGYETLATPSPTPTTTPTQAPASQSQSLSEAGAPICSTTVPEATPWLFSGGATTTTSVTLTFSDISKNVTGYTVEYGKDANKLEFAAPNIAGKDDRKATISSLAPNTLYYFRIRADNGCAVGTWSNVLPVTTKLSSLVVTQTNIDVPETTDSVSSPTPQPKTGSPLDETQKEVTQDSQKTYDLEVKVVDNNSNPVENATVEVHSTVKTAQTDDNGIARFEDVESGAHILSIAYAGYEAEQTIFLQGSENNIKVSLTVQKKTQYMYYVAIPVALLLGFLIAKRIFKKNTKKVEISNSGYPLHKI
jgi:hypothetical protein